MVRFLGAVLCSYPVCLQVWPLDDDMARLFTRQLLSALEFLHSKGIVQRDIKPSNLLVPDDGEGRGGGRLQTKK